MEATTDRLLERDRELAALRALLRDARAGEGRLAILEGPAGIGKTALVSATCAVAADEGFAVLDARAAELEGGFAFGLVRQLFEPALHGLSPDERVEVMSGAAALAERALGHSSAEPADDAGLSASLHGLYWLCANLAERAPLVLALDDAHWGDLPSLRWLCYLARRLDGLPLVALAATRPGASPAVAPLLDELRRERDARVVTLAPLSEDGVRGVVEDAFGEDATSEFVHACYRQSAGNPLLARELASALLADGGRPDATAAGQVLALPPREAMRAVLIRLGRLPAAAAALARAVAVLESDATVRDAAAIAGIDERAAADAIDSLIAAGILAADPPLRFLHPLLRAAVYDDIPLARRTGDHARAANLLRADPAAGERVTAHLLACEPTGDDWAIGHLRTAARDALERGAPETAVAALERCLAERPSPDVRPGVLHDLGQAQRLIAPERAVERLSEAHTTIADARERIAIARDLAAALLGCARGGDAYALLERTLADVPDDDRELALVIEADLLATGLLGAHLSEPVGERFARLQPPAGETPGERLMLASIARYLNLTGAPAGEAADIAERALAGGQLLFDQATDTTTYVMTMLPLIRAGRHDTMRALCEHAIADAQRRGSPLGVAVANAMLAFLEFARGDLRSAESAAQAVLDLSHEAGLITVAPAARILVEVAIARGQLELAEAVLVDNDLVGDVPDVWAPMTLHARGALRLAQGRVDEGIADLLALGTQERAVGRAVPAPWRATVAPALAARGEPDHARRLATEELETARRMAAPGSIGRALRTIARIEGGTAALDHLREAVMLLEPTPFRLEYAQALTDLGAALRRANQRSEARELLRQGLDLAHRCGATVLAEHARQELLATGARPRKLVVTGIDALTASERRVAELAAQGLTNKQIAQALFVTHKTVATHLAHTYAKLDISSRAELAANLGAADAAMTT